MNRDTISRQAALDALAEQGLITAMLIVDRVPPTQPDFMWVCPNCGLEVHSDFAKCVRCGRLRNKRSTGKWIVLKHGHNAMCSSCHQTFVDAYDLENWDNYCRHCGAIMEGIEAEENR